jgi:hypothetical protein
LVIDPPFGGVAVSESLAGAGVEPAVANVGAVDPGELCAHPPASASIGGSTAAYTSGAVSAPVGSPWSLDGISPGLGSPPVTPGCEPGGATAASFGS